MDKNVALAVFFLFWISVADVAHATFRYLAAASPPNNTTSAQVSGENKQGPKPLSNNSPPLDPKPFTKTDLVSPSQNQVTDNSKSLNFPNSGSSTGQNQIVPKGVNGKNLSPLDKGKNPDHVNDTDLLSPPDKGKSPEHVNGMGLLSPSPVKENVNGSHLLSPSPVKKHVNGTDLLSTPVNETGNRKDGGVKDKAIDDKSNDMDNGKNGRVKDKTVEDKSNENGKSGGAKEKTNDDKHSERDNGKIGIGKEKTGDKSIETDNGMNGGVKEKNGVGKEKTIDDKTENGKNGREKEKPIDDKRNVTDNEKNDRVKEKSDKNNETDNGKNGGVKEKNTDDKSNEMDNGKNDGVKEKTIDDKSNETCNGLRKCTDLKALIACIQNFDSGSRKVTILVQNEGEKNLTVTITIPTAVENPLKLVKISKHQTQKINISLSTSKNTKLILDAGNGECVLHMERPESEENFFIYLPSYYRLLTPINGAYFLILSVLIFGVTWACCKCRRRRWNDGVPYQELEMGLPESVSAMNMETAEGWDEGWDDDWDDNNAVKSPGASRIGSISANGLTSRSPNRDGWEHDWNE